MADLLECLLQIKGLRETAKRLSALAHDVEAARWTRPAPGNGPSAAALTVHLAEAESLHGAWLRRTLTITQPALGQVDDLGAAGTLQAQPGLDRFLALRRDNLALLDRCSAEDLARSSVYPTRREMTVADLVAVMLASDTEALGKIRQALGLT